MTNNTEEYVLHQAVRIGCSLFLLFDLICGLIGNLVLCIAVTRNKSLRTPMGMLICNLAVTGTIQTLFCVPTLLYFTFTPAVHKTGYAFCYIEQFLRHLSGYVALATMVNIAYERHQAIAKPFDKTIRVKRVRVTIPCMWLLGVGMALIGTLAFFDDVDKALCLHKLTIDGEINMQFGVYFTLPIGVLAIICIVYLYSNMLCLVHRHTISSSKLFTKINKVKPAGDQNDKVSANKKTTENKKQKDKKGNVPEISIMQITTKEDNPVINRNINHIKTTEEKTDFTGDVNQFVSHKTNPDKEEPSKTVICDQGEISGNIPADVDYNTNSKSVLQGKSSSITNIIDFNSKQSNEGKESLTKLQGVANVETLINKTAVQQTSDISQSLVPPAEIIMLNTDVNTIACHPHMTGETTVIQDHGSKSPNGVMLLANGLLGKENDYIKDKSGEEGNKIKHTQSEDYVPSMIEHNNKLLNPSSSLPILSSGSILLKNEPHKSASDHGSRSDEDVASINTCITNVGEKDNIQGNTSGQNLVTPSNQETTIHSALTLNDIQPEKTSDNYLQLKNSNNISNGQLSNSIEADVSTVALVDVYDENGAHSKQKATNISDAKKPEIVGAVCVMNPKNREKGRRKVEAKTAKTTAMAVVCFLICWLPYPTTLLVVYVESRKTGLLSELLFNYYAIAVSLSFVSSAVNPFIYGILNNQFKAELKKMYESSTKFCSKSAKK